MKIMIAIDPGKSGAIAVKWISGMVEVFKMPDTPRDIFDFLVFVTKEAIPGGVQVEAVLEKVHAMPTDGKASIGKFMRHAGHLDMALIALGIPFREVTPQKWQKQLGIKLTHGGSNEAKKKRKDEIWAWCQQRYPDMKVYKYAADALAMLTIWMEGKI